MGNKLIDAENTNEDREIIQIDQRIYKIQEYNRNSIGHMSSLTPANKRQYSLHSRGIQNR